MVLLPPLEDGELRPFDDEFIDTPAEETVEAEDIDISDVPVEEQDFELQDEAEVPSIFPEDVPLPLPSKIISIRLKPHLTPLMLVERELRRGQANDALEGLRIGLSNKSLLFQTRVNQSVSTKQSTRAWADVRNAQTHILEHAHTYQRAWHALGYIGAPEDSSTYQKLEAKDLKTVNDITNAKRYGQGSDTLAWFWRIGPNKEALTGEWMEECKSLS